MDAFDRELDFLQHSDLADELHDQGGLATVREAAQMARVSVAVVKMWVQRDQVVSALVDGRRLIGIQSLWDCELARREAPGWGDRGRRLGES